jgi:CheY-like chemotaxis protein
MKPEKHKILLVDDDDFQLELIAAQLADIGWHHVLCANSGTQALACFDEHGSKIVAIIIDLSMPDMDGLVLMRHLTQCGFGGGIILVSGLPVDILSSAGGLAQAHGLNILGCLRKPCEPLQLQQFLESLLAPMAGVDNQQDAFKLEPAHLEAAINLSMETALNLDMPERLLCIVAEAGLSPDDFVIEVTESRLMVDRAVAMESLTRLSLMGFTLSIDDFGTGYSSLMQLIDLPFKELKIDGSFVQRASHEHKAQTAVCLSVILGLTLKMEGVAEGVETAEQLAFVQDSGGYGGSRLSLGAPNAVCRVHRLAQPCTG